MSHKTDDLILCQASAEAGQFSDVMSYCTLRISWSDKVPNVQVLAHAGLPTMYTLLRKCKLPCVGHMHGMVCSQSNLIAMFDSRPVTRGAQGAFAPPPTCPEGLHFDTPYPS